MKSSSSAMVPAIMGEEVLAECCLFSRRMSEEGVLLSVSSDFGGLGGSWSIEMECSRE